MAIERQESVSLRLTTAVRASMIVGLFLAANVFGLVPTIHATSDAPIVITSPAPGSTVTGTSTTVAGTGPAGKKFYLLADGTPVSSSPLTVGSDGTWGYLANTLSSGSHTFTAELLDGTALISSTYGYNNAGGQVNLNSGSVTPYPADMSQINSGAMDAGDNRIFLDDGTSKVKAYSTVTNTLIGSVDSGYATLPNMDAIMGLTYDATRGKLYIFTQYETLVVNPTTLVITNRIAAPSQAWGQWVADPTTANVYEEIAAGGVEVFNRDTLSYSTLSALSGVDIFYMRISPDGRYLMYSKGGVQINTQTVNALDTTTNTVLSATYSVSDTAYQFTMTPDDSQAFVQTNTGIVSVFNTSTGATIRTLAGSGDGEAPISVNAAGTRLYTGKDIYNIGAGTLTTPLNGGQDYIDPTDSYIYETSSPATAAGTVNVYTTSGTLVTTITGLPATPTKILFAGTQAFSLNTNNGSYSVINTSSNTLVATVGPGTRHTAQFFTLPDGSKTYAIAPTFGSTVQRVDPTTGAAISTIQLPGTLFGDWGSMPAYLDSSGAFLYTLSQGSNGQYITKISTSTDSVVSNLPLTSFPGPGFSLTVDETAGVAYAAGNPGGISKINLTTGATTAYLASSILNPRQVIMTPDASTLYVLTQSSNTGSVYKVSTSGMTLTATQTYTSQPVFIALSADSSSVYALLEKFSSPYGYTLQKQSAADLSTLATQNNVDSPVGSNVEGITVAPSGVIFLVGEPYTVVVDAATLSVLDQYHTAPDYNHGQARDLFIPGSVALNPTNFYFASTSSTFTLQFPPLAVTTTSIPDASAFENYNQTLQTTNSEGSVTWSLSSGSLPPGYSLSSGGVLSGSINTTGVYAFTVAATDTRGIPATQALTLTVSPNEFAVATSSLSDALVGVNYSQHLMASHATGGVTWSQVSGSLPNGYNLSSDGIVTGTTSVSGTYGFTVTATENGSGLASSATLNITVNADPLGGQFGPPGLATSELGQYDSHGQENWTQNSSNSGQPSVNAIGMQDPSDVSVDPVNHRLYVEDYSNERILVYLLDTQNHIISPTATYVIGQTDMMSSGSGTTATTLSLSYNPGLAYDAGRGYLFVSDTNNNRVLVYDTNKLATGMSASYVIGQSSFLVSNSGDTASSLYEPSGLAFDPSTNNLYVSDSFNDRVMVFDTTTMTLGMSATNVIGQTDFGIDNWTTNAKNLSYPLAVALDSQSHRLFVADNVNSRIMIFNISNVSNGPTAIAEIGEPDMTSNSVDLVAGGLSDPQGLTYDAANQRLFVADNADSRVLIYDVTAPTNDMAPTAVLGQPDFDTQVTNAPSQSTVPSPEGLWYDPSSHQLFVSDIYSNRVMIYNLLNLSGSALPTGTINQTYASNITASNEWGTHAMSVTGGALPPGLNLGADGSITGTPTSAGTYNFTVRINDNIGSQGVMWDTSAQAITIASIPQPPASPFQNQSRVSTPQAAPIFSPNPSPSDSPVTVLNSDPNFTDSTGSTQDLATGQAVQFDIQIPATSSGAGSTETHTATVTAVGPDYADVLIHTKPIALHLLVGQTVNVDITGSGNPILSVHLASVAGSKAQLVFKLLTAAISPTPKSVVHSSNPISQPNSNGAVSPFFVAAALLIIAIIIVAWRRKRRTSIVGSVK